MLGRGEASAAIDITPPSTPSNFTAAANYDRLTLSWTGSTDDVGVAGYNVYRCQPPAKGQSCTGVWIANTTLNEYKDNEVAEDAVVCNLVDNNLQLLRGPGACRARGRPCPWRPRQVEPIVARSSVYISAPSYGLMGNATVRYCRRKRMKFVIGLEFT